MPCWLLVLHALFRHAILSLNATLVQRYVTAFICCTQHLRHSIFLDPKP